MLNFVRNSSKIVKYLLTFMFYLFFGGHFHFIHVDTCVTQAKETFFFCGVEQDF
jgi:hypothetical protein